MTTRWQADAPLRDLVTAVARLGQRLKAAETATALRGLWNTIGNAMQRLDALALFARPAPPAEAE